MPALYENPDEYSKIASFLNEGIDYWNQFTDSLHAYHREVRQNNYQNNYNDAVTQAYKTMWVILISCIACCICFCMIPLVVIGMCMLMKKKAPAEEPSYQESQKEICVIGVPNKAAAPAGAPAPQAYPPAGAPQAYPPAGQAYPPAGAQQFVAQ